MFVDSNFASHKQMILNNAFNIVASFQYTCFLKPALAISSKIDIHTCTHARMHTHTNFSSY